MPVNFMDVILNKKRSIIESLFNLLKNKLQLWHSKHGNIFNLFDN